MLCKLETHDGVLTVIRSPDICTNAEFKLDKPMVIGRDQLFELIKGQWMVVEWIDGERVSNQINGRWKLIENG